MLYRWLCVAFLFPAVAHPAPLLMPFGELQELCKSSNTEQRATCDAYIVGVAEGNVATLGLLADVLKREDIGPWSCPDLKRDRERLTGPVRKYINNSKDQPDTPAIWVVIIALRESFPCPK